MSTELKTEILIDGLVFTEGARWHGGALWFSDVFDQKVLTVTMDGDLKVIAETATRPSGLGFLPGGQAIVVSMTDRRLLELRSGADPAEYADLSHHSDFPCNDMVVDRKGRAYVGTFGFDQFGGALPAPGRLLMVDTDRSVRIVADELGFPNGLVVSLDGNTLIVSESMSGWLTAFDINDDGTLDNRRLFADLRRGGQTVAPDGLAIDSEGAVWVSLCSASEYVRVLEGGEITDTVSVPGQWTQSCALGGPDGRTLFMCTADTNIEDFQKGKAAAAIRTVRVDVPAVAE